MTYDSRMKLDELIVKINQDFSTEECKARAIYIWIANNVEYDVRKYNRFKKNKNKISRKKWKNHYKYEQSVSKKTYRKKKGICGDYSILYKHLCSLCGLECEVISGYSKTRNKDIGKKFGEKHAWNAIRINEEWKLVDVTWSAGYVNEETNIFRRSLNDYYYFTNPDKFFLKHYPRKQKWLLTQKTKENFKKTPLYGKELYHLDYETEEPNEGVIYADNQQIVLKFNDHQKLRNIFYKFDKEEFGHYVYPNTEEECITVKIDYKERRTDYMQLFINGSYYATYKIKRR